MEKFTMSDDQVEHGLHLHNKSLVVDNAKMGLEVWSQAQVEKMNEMFDSGKSYGEVNQTIERMRANEILIPNHETRKIYCEMVKMASVTGTSWSQDATTMERSLESIARTNLICSSLRDILISAVRVDDIHKAKKEGKMAVRVEKN